MLHPSAYARPESYRYRLQSHPSYYFEVGKSETLQVLFGLLGDSSYVLQFDSLGRLLDVQRGVVPRMSLRQAQDALSAEVRKRFQLQDGTISVCRFWLDGPEAGIEDIGEDLGEFVASPSSFSSEEQDELREALADWLASGMYVLWWEQPFEVNSAGEVETS